MSLVPKRGAPQPDAQRRPPPAGLGADRDPAGPGARIPPGEREKGPDCRFDGVYRACRSLSPQG